MTVSGLLVLYKDFIQINLVEKDRYRKLEKFEPGTPSKNSVKLL
jgi:hypothetical protein